MNTKINNTNKTIYEGDIIDILKTIYDPEIEYSIYDMGLIYEINVNMEKIHILMTLTSVNCPEAQSIPDNVKSELQSKFPTLQIDVEITFEPEWSVDNMSDEILLKLGLL